MSRTGKIAARPAPSTPDDEMSPGLFRHSPPDGELRRLGYKLVGAHSAVKPCLWLNRSLHGWDGCYKWRFYGVESHRCLQMTPWLACNQRCLFCWRPFSTSPPSGSVDLPEAIVDGCLTAQGRFTCGYGGDPSADSVRCREAARPAHAAVSLVGEPTLYPHLAGLLGQFHRRGMTTFLVTNGSLPEVVAGALPTQLYVSLDAWDAESYRHICHPIGPRFDDVVDSLEKMADNACRTVVRTTLVRGLNHYHPERFARLAERARPDFVEVKGYMHLGYSRRRLPREAMPSHAQVMEFAGTYANAMGYQVCDDVEVSRVALLTPDGSPPRPLRAAVPRPRS